MENKAKTRERKKKKVGKVGKKTQVYMQQSVVTPVKAVGAHPL